MATILPPTTTPAPAAVPGTLTLNGMTAVPNATTTPAQVAAATAAGWTPANPAPTSTLGALTGVTNSPSGSPASSSTGLQNLGAQTAINGVTNPTPTTPTATKADFLNALNSYTGTTIDNNTIQQGVAAGYSEEEATEMANSQIQKNIAANNALTQNNQQLADQQASDLADTAENDAELAAAKAQVDQQMATLGQSETNKAADAGYGVSAVGTNQTGATAYVAAQKSYAYTQLQNLANQKQAAINSGNTKAIDAINDSYNKVVADLQTKLSDDMTQEAQKASDLSANQQDKATSAFQSYLTTAPINSAASSQLETWGGDWNALSGSQHSSIMSQYQTAFDAAQKTGNYNNPDGSLNYEQAWSAIQGGLLNSSKSQSSSLVQSSYIDALKTASSNGAPESVLDAIGKAAQSPDATAASIYSAAGKYASDPTTTVHDVKNADGSTTAITLDHKGNIINSTNLGGSADSSLTATDLEDAATYNGLNISDVKSAPLSVQSYLLKTGKDGTPAQVVTNLNSLGAGKMTIRDFNNFLAKQDMSPEVDNYFSQWAQSIVPASSNNNNTGGNFVTRLWSNMFGGTNDNVFTGTNNQ
jgi:hypothetical protein